MKKFLITILFLASILSVGCASAKRNVNHFERPGYINRSECIQYGNDSENCEHYDVSDQVGGGYGYGPSGFASERFVPDYSRLTDAERAMMQLPSGTTIVSQAPVGGSPKASSPATDDVSLLIVHGDIQEKKQKELDARVKELEKKDGTQTPSSTEAAKK